MGIIIHFIISHVISYPCPKNINLFWNMGFLLGFIMFVNLVSGFLLGLHYVPGVNTAYYSVIYILRELYFGWLFRFIHANGVSVGFFLIIFHITRACIYGSYHYISNTWFSGIIIFILLIVISFIGYILPWGQMSFWGATVITNLLQDIPCLVSWICGGFYISDPTLSRFFIFHFILAFVLFAVMVFHILYLHKISSTNPLGYNINNKIQFYPFIVYKDVFLLLYLVFVILFQVYFGFILLSHSDNVFEVNILVTPLHIVPEWYFLYFYIVLKVIPNKNTGFMVMFLFILALNIYGESFYISGKIQIQSPIFYEVLYMFLLILFVFIYLLWVGAQLPQENYLAYPLYTIILLFFLG